MTFHPTAIERAASAAEQLKACGAHDLIANLIRDVWMTNVARFDPAAGDNFRVIATQSSENIVERLQMLMRDDSSWKATGIEVNFPKNSMLMTCGELRIHFVKAPQGSRLSPDWNHDFAWETASNVRAASASANDDVFRVPRREVNIEPLLPSEGLGSYGDANNVNEFFIVWAGEISEQPLTAGWLVIPSLSQVPVLAVERLWLDERPTAKKIVIVNNQSALESLLEPHVHIRLKKDVAKASNDS